MRHRLRTEIIRDGQCGRQNSQTQLGGSGNPQADLRGGGASAAADCWGRQGVHDVFGQLASGGDARQGGLDSFLFSFTLNTCVNETRNLAIADKPARRVYRSVKVTKHSTIPYVKYSFLLSNCNFVFKTKPFCDISLQKCRDLEIWVRGHSRSLKVAQFDRLCMVSY